MVVDIDFFFLEVIVGFNGLSYGFFFLEWCRVMVLGIEVFFYYGWVIWGLGRVIY